MEAPTPATLRTIEALKEVGKAAETAGESMKNLVPRDRPVRNPAFQQNEALRELQKNLHHRKNAPKMRFKK